MWITFCTRITFTIVVVGHSLKVDKALFAAAYIRMRLTFKYTNLFDLLSYLWTSHCGLHLNAAYIGERLKIKKVWYYLNSYFILSENYILDANFFLAENLFPYAKNFFQMISEDFNNNENITVHRSTSWAC